MALTGDPRNADPVCVLSPFHDRVEQLTTRQRSDAYVMRGRPSRQAGQASTADPTPDATPKEHGDAQHLAG